MSRSRAIRTSCTDDAGRDHRAGIVVSGPVHSGRDPRCMPAASESSGLRRCLRQGAPNPRIHYFHHVRSCPSTFRLPGAGSSARCRLPCHARLPCDVIASPKRVAIAEKVRALFAQIDLCDAKSACRSSARDERQNGRLTAFASTRLRRAPHHGCILDARCTQHETPFFMCFAKTREMLSLESRRLRCASHARIGAAGVGRTGSAPEKKLPGIVDRPKNRD